jgi:hypothetical protein
MYKMRDEWTDERLDDFREEVNRRFDKLEGRFEATHRLLLYSVIGIATLVLAGYAALAGLIALVV